ncbi:probable G-protein coupled receptor 139 [Hypanus sabinus]|uniref:probable G-protein coupled receptor 139 n=1 Tax=Hypanus sabinus TaxID=79690 RepID=UPI0028C3B156|nr:probable G-protein coupled receptor 139 [Hypanus sabinus]
MCQRRDHCRFPQITFTSTIYRRSPFEPKPSYSVSRSSEACCIKLSGATVNVVAVVILSRGNCGLSGRITSFLVSMALADLVVVLTSVVLNRIIGVYFPAGFLSITPLCKLKTFLVYSAKDISVWLTVAFTFDRFVAICCRKIRNNFCIEKAEAVISIVFVLSCLRNIPWCFALEPLFFVDSTPWYCVFKLNYYSSAPWRAFSFLNHILTPFVPLILILFFNVLTVRHIAVASRIRKALLGKKIGEAENDSEVENRRKSVILLLSISGSSILLWMTFVVHYLYLRIANVYNYTGNDDPVYILQEAGYMLLLLSCCINTFIYTVTQARFRKELKNLLKYPLNIIIQSIK